MTRAYLRHYGAAYFTLLLGFGVTLLTVYAWSFQTHATVWESRDDAQTAILLCILGMLASSFAAVLVEVNIKARTKALTLASKLTESLRIKQEDAERRSREIFSLYDNAPCGFHSLDANGIVVEMNQTELNWLGKTREEVIGQLHFPDVLTPASRERFFQNFARFKVTGEVRGIETELIRGDGRTMKLLVNASAIRDARGNYLASRSTLVDITDRKRIENALQRSEDFLQNVIDNIPLMVFIKDAQTGRFVLFNRAGEQLIGISRQQVLGRVEEEAFSQRQAACFRTRDVARRMERCIPEVTEDLISTRHFGNVLLRTQKIPIYDGSGELTYFLGISEDVTEQKSIEERYQEARNAAKEIDYKGISELDQVRTDVGLALGGVIDLLNILLDTCTDQTLRQYIERAKSSSEELVSTVVELRVIT